MTLPNGPGIEEWVPMTEQKSSIQALAAACAARLPASPTTYEDDWSGFAPELERLLAGIRASDSRFVFDREGRPGAVAAIRQALPAIETELLDAVLEDVACELAAVQEALYRVALASRR
jgi:hypothetical protein